MIDTTDKPKQTLDQRRALHAWEAIAALAELDRLWNHSPPFALRIFKSVPFQTVQEADHEQGSANKNALGGHGSCTEQSQTRIPSRAVRTSKIAPGNSIPEKLPRVARALCGGEFIAKAAAGK